MSTILRSSLLSFALVPSVVLTAQKPAEQEVLVRAKAQKLGAAFLTRGGWLTDFAAARKQAQARQRAILVYVTRSHPRSPSCEALEGGMLRGDAFLAAVRELVRFCHIVTGIAADAPKGRLARLLPRQVPALLFLDPDGLPIGRVSQVAEPAALNEVLRSKVRPFMALRARAAKGDKAARAALLFERLTLGHLSAVEVRKTLASADYLSKAQRARIRAALSSMELMVLITAMDPKDPKSTQVVVDRVLKMYADKHAPKGPMAGPFWRMILTHAEKIEDPEMFAEALTGLQQAVGRKSNEELFSRLEDKLRLLRFMKGRGRPDKRK